MFTINETIRIPWEELQFTYVRSSGPGGQNVNKVASKAVLRWTPGVALGPWNHSYHAMMKTGESVLSIPTADMMETLVDIGNCSGESVDKFKHFGPTPLPSEKVTAPLIAETLAEGETVNLRRKMTKREDCI